MPLRFPFSTVAIRQRYGVKGFENLNSISIGPFRRETLSDAKKQTLGFTFGKKPTFLFAKYKALSNGGYNCIFVVYQRRCFKTPDQP